MRCWRAIDFIESPPHDLLPLGLAHPNIKAFEWDALRLQYTFIPIGYTNLSTIRRCGRRYVMAQRVIDGLYCRICAWHWHVSLVQAARVMRARPVRRARSHGAS
jgi:hypothetical protein